MIKRRLAGIAVALALSTALAAPAAALDNLSMLIFGAPSLGSLLPPIIKQFKLDERNGLSLTFAERTPDAYTAQFNSGEFQVGGSAAVLTVGQADVRGVKVAYLFNIFDYWTGVVTSNPAIKRLKDLEAHTLAAAHGTTNFAMFDWLARQQGVDMGKVSILNTATPGLIGYAMADRADAVQLWEPAYTVLLTKKPSVRTLDLEIPQRWQAFAGSAHIPFLGVAAHIEWVEQHRDLVPKLFATYKAAAEWMTANPDAAAKLFAPRDTPEGQAALAGLIKANERLGLNLQWASDMRKGIRSVYAAGQSTTFLGSAPSEASIYQAP